METFKMKIRFTAIVIGCGKIGFGNKKYFIEGHAYNYFQNKNISLVCGIDKNKSTLKDFSNTFKCDTSNNISNVLDKYKTDIISVCTPDKTHFKVINLILSSEHKPSIIFLEKPCFQNMKEFNIILKKIKTTKTEIIVNHSRRFNQNFLKLKNMIKKNYFGKFLSSQSIYYNGWLHNATHCVDDLLFLFNNSLKVNQISKTLFFTDKKDETFDVVLKSTDNKKNMLFLGVDQKYYQIFDTELRFEKYRISIDNFGHNFFIQKKIKNKLNENILSDKKILFKKNKISNMENSIQIIAKYLKTKNKSCLVNYRMSDIKKTMKIIWEVKKKYENKYKKK